MKLTPAQIDEARHLTERIAEDLGDYTLCRENKYAGFWIQRGVKKLSLHYSSRLGRVTIEGHYPEGSSRVTAGWAKPHRITCAVSRGRSAIAADITRRLLPAYHADLDKVLQAVADHLQVQSLAQL
ncbi:hypothetical protein ABZ897_53870 [Nonomuraea sp. NPDC046802]|uniref:hypothetical protein n=1 Tax=Nonomuraea sp. NPDC046802 TaxID=3154919 RepID=UPI0033F6D997